MPRPRKILLLAAIPLALAALSFAAFCFLAPTLDAGGWASANRELMKFWQNIYLYTLDHHQLPGTTLPEILKTLDAARPPGTPPARYDHIRANRDPWGNPFILNISPTHLTLRSAGPNHIDDHATADDLRITIDLPPAPPTRPSPPPPRGGSTVPPHLTTSRSTHLPVSPPHNSL
ncbi:MAG TPA: hypothetical protein VHQ47_16535 [Phycisphaerae bacterium]|nr:hypothetical protein [Phycisphaerae bacterium]